MNLRLRKYLKQLFLANGWLWLRVSCWKAATNYPAKHTIAHQNVLSDVFVVTQQNFDTSHTAKPIQELTHLFGTLPKELFIQKICSELGITMKNQVICECWVCKCFWLMYFVADFCRKILSIHMVFRLGIIMSSWIYVHFFLPVPLWLCYYYCCASDMFLYKCYILMLLWWCICDPYKFARRKVQQIFTLINWRDDKASAILYPRV